MNKERLFNEYGAAIGDKAQALDARIDDCMEGIMDKVNELNLDYRDCYSYVIMAVSNCFAYETLKYAANKKKQEKTK